MFKCGDIEIQTNKIQEDTDTKNTQAQQRYKHLIMKPHKSLCKHYKHEKL